MIIDITRISNWFSEQISPWVSVILEENPQIPYLFAILAGFIVLFVRIRSKKSKKGKPAKAGYRNFRGDVWYPDGRIWHEKTQTWEEPDYKK